MTAVGAMVMLSILLGMYFLPVIVSTSRHTGNAVAVFLVCLFFGWTMIGWLIALIMAFGRPSGATVVNVHQYAAPPPAAVPQSAPLPYAPAPRVVSPRATLSFGQRR